MRRAEKRVAIGVGLTGRDEPDRCGVRRAGQPVQPGGQPAISPCALVPQELRHPLVPGWRATPAGIGTVGAAADNRTVRPLIPGPGMAGRGGVDRHGARLPEPDGHGREANNASLAQPTTEAVPPMSRRRCSRPDAGSSWEGYDSRAHGRSRYPTVRRRADRLSSGVVGGPAYDPGVDQATSVPDRLCCKCGKTPVEKEHILCPGCTTKLQENTHSNWDTHVPEGATVVTR
jgi:hypothetical protein